MLVYQRVCVAIPDHGSTHNVCNEFERRCIEEEYQPSRHLYIICTLRTSECISFCKQNAVVL